MRRYTRLLQWLAQNPTVTWGRGDGRELHLDLDRATLCGVPLGAPLEDLSFLGRGQPTRFEGWWSWPQLGLIVICYEGLESFAAILDVAGQPVTRRPFPGRITHHGQRLARFPTWTPPDVLQTFGPPIHREDDEDETVLYFEHERHAFDVELWPGGGLRALDLHTPGPGLRRNQWDGS